jgi:TonB family protein
MNDLFLYLLKVTGGLAIIAVPYYFLLRNDPNLAIKRYYLLTGVLVTWIFPLISFRQPDLVREIAPVFFIDPSGNSAGSKGAQVFLNPSSSGPFSWLHVALPVYIAGLVLIITRNAAVLARWNRAWKTSDPTGGIAYTTTSHIFSLFNRIFIPRSFRDHADLETVLLHEKAHLRQMHFIDLTMMELTLLLTWFNPFSWLISRMMKENHEHLADRKVLMSGVSPARYRAQLLNQTLGIPVFRLGIPFNHSITLKRFNMMKKPLKSNAGIVKFLIVVPFVLVTLALTAGTAQIQKQVKGKVLFADTGDPAYGASIVVAGGTLGTVAGPDGTFSLEVEGNIELVISFVGYESLRIKSSEIARKALMLEPGVFEVDPDIKPASGPKPVSQPKPETVKNSSGDEEVFFIVEEMPMFPGGKEALARSIYSRLRYPESARNSKLEGEVQVQFTVTTSGKLENIQAVRNTDPVFIEPALAVFRDMPDWNPGMQRSKPVKTRVVVPVKFKLDEK